MANVKEQKRISQLDKISTEDFNKLIPVDSPNPSEEEVAQAAESNNWWLAMDYRKEDDETVPDAGTVRFPISRVALLNEYRVVPSTMLPSYVDEMVPGNMTYDSATGKYTFTANDGTGYVYSCPDSQRAEGEREPRTDLIYLDNEPETSNVQYRYIGGTVQKFQALPNSLLLVDGNGTNVTIGTAAIDATRQIDIDVGAPAAKATGNTNPLQISTGDNKQLYHANSGVTANTYGTTAAATPAFGATFTSHKIDVDATGHVTGAADYTVKIPDTVASNTVNGLAKTGTSATHIGASSSAGTSTGNVYSAYDHVHNVSNLYFGTANSLLNYKPSDTADKVITAKDLLNTVYGYTAGTTYRAVNAEGSVVQTKPTLTVGTTGTGTSEKYSLINSEIGANTNVYSFAHGNTNVAMNYCADNDTSMVNVVASESKSSTSWYQVNKTSETEVSMKMLSKLEYETRPLYNDTNVMLTTQYIGGSNISNCSTNYSALTLFCQPIGGGMWSTHNIGLIAAPYTSESQNYTLPLVSPSNNNMVLNAVLDDKYTNEEGGYLVSETTPRYILKWTDLDDLNPCQYVYANAMTTTGTGTASMAADSPIILPIGSKEVISNIDDVSLSNNHLVLTNFKEGVYRISFTIKVTPGTSDSDKYYELNLMCDNTTIAGEVEKTTVGGGVLDWTLKGPQYFTASALVALDNEEILGQFGFYWKLDDKVNLTGTTYGLVSYSVERLK